MHQSTIKRTSPHLSLQEQANHLNQMLRGHYAYYGIAGNLPALLRVHRVVEHYRRKMLGSRSWHGTIRWEQFQEIKEQFPLLRPSSTFLTRSYKLSPYCEINVRRAQCRKSARWVLWEPEVGDLLRRPGGRIAISVPTAIFIPLQTIPIAADL